MDFLQPVTLLISYFYNHIFQSNIENGKHKNILEKIIVTMSHTESNISYANIMRRQQIVIVFINFAGPETAKTPSANYILYRDFGSVVFIGPFHKIT